MSMQGMSGASIDTPRKMRRATRDSPDGSFCYDSSSAISRAYVDPPSGCGVSKILGTPSSILAFTKARSVSMLILPVAGYNTFAARHPELLEEWDYISNYLIADPDEILGSYAKTVWWKRKDCGRRYELSPKAKLLFEKRHMKSCRYCKGTRRKMQHFF